MQTIKLKETPVYTFAVKSEDLIDIVHKATNIEKLIGYDVVYIPINRTLPRNIKKYLVEQTNCKDKFSKTTQTTYFVNACIHCDALQGANFVHQEVSSPFTGMNATESNTMKYIEFKLKTTLLLIMKWGGEMRFIGLSFN
ncbi:hypothetical protein KFZ56_01770 [Virgibacillus sp. NKC19-3]|uniref:hypothetical protein n=1 Tax=Virgibacillus saliphilus TaxID=2831674 RepID=UPI001C9B3981|nr:hypothetical protein [Virgibacillus sp. NKC19-3]MBY7141836.1 hypothetical protein [Virgibacillus sp. NKC19-3]